MGIWEIFFPKKKEEKELLNVKESALEAELQKAREHAFSKMVPKAAGKALKVLEALDGLKTVIKSFEGLSSDVENPRAVSIAKNMRANFIERALPLLEVKPPEETFESILEFNQKISRILSETTKINIDNRYLFGLFKEQSQKLRGEMRQTAERNSELEEMLKGERNLLQKFSELKREISLLREVQRDLDGLEKERKGLEKKLSESGGDRDSKVGETLEKTEEKAEKAKTRLEELTSKAVTPIHSLEKALRKYAHATLNNDERDVEKILSSPKDVLEETETLQRVCAGVKEMIERGNLELKNKESVLHTLEFVCFKDYGELLAERKNAEKELRELERELSPLKARKVSETEKKERDAKLEKLLKKNKEQRKVIEEDVKTQLENVLDAFEKTTGKKVELKG